MHMISRNLRPFKVSFALLRKLCRSVKINCTIKLKKKKKQPARVPFGYENGCSSDDYLYPLLPEDPPYTITTTDLTSPIRLDILPSEILLTIMTLVETTDLLSLKRSSNQLRSLIDTHANWIANELIKINFMSESKLLKSKLQNGWLMPTLPVFRDEELRLVYARQKRSNAPVAARVWNGLGQTLPIISELTQPGPHYLLFLMENSRDILVFWEMISTLITESQMALDELNTGMVEPYHTESVSNENEIYNKVECSENVHLRAFEDRIRLYCAKKTLQKLNWLAYDADIWDPWARRRRLVETADMKKVLGWYYD